MHYDNILKNGDSWLVIDPKGIIGDPVYDKVGCLIRKPLAEFLNQPNQTETLNIRAQLVSEYFNLDKTKILEWTLVQCVMACCWFLEDNQDPSDCLQFVKIVNQMLTEKIKR